MFTEEILKSIKKHALETSPEECCGLLLKQGERTSVYPTKNASTHDRRFTFSIDVLDMLEAHKQGAVIGYYHSHNTPVDSAIFSETDIHNVRIHKLISVLYNTCSNQFYFLDDAKQLNYLGRQFKLGSSDCFALVREYYQRELGLNITDYFRDSRWFLRDPDLWTAHLDEHGGIVVHKGNDFDESVLRVHDLILIKGQEMQNPSHGGVYIGNGMLLHHPYKALSTIEPLCGTLQENVKLIVRHKSLYGKHS